MFKLRHSRLSLCLSHNAAMPVPGHGLHWSRSQPTSLTHWPDLTRTASLWIYLNCWLTLGIVTTPNPGPFLTSSLPYHYRLVRRILDHQMDKVTITRPVLLPCPRSNCTLLGRSLPCLLCCFCIAFALRTACPHCCLAMLTQIAEFLRNTFLMLSNIHVKK